MISAELQQKLELLAARVFDKAGMDLIEFKVGGRPNDVFIQVTADKPSGGINIQECGILNKSLVAAIEQENLLPPEAFSLELSSPGLDRPLVTRRDFMRLIGQEIHFVLSEPVGGKKEIKGILIEVGESSLSIDKGKVRLAVPLSSIIKGTLVI